MYILYTVVVVITCRLLYTYTLALVTTRAQVLHETALVETSNLKAAIEYQLKNCELSNGAYCALQSCAVAFLCR